MPDLTAVPAVRDPVFPIAEPQPLTVLSARRGHGTALGRAVERQTGLLLPPVNRTVGGGGIRFIWIGPDQWLVRGPLESDGLAAHAGISDQSDVWTIFSLPTGEARRVLSKGCAVDLHEGAFKPGHAAVTGVNRFSVVLWRPDSSGDRICAAVFRSFANSFNDWLTTASGREGLPHD